MNLSKEQAQSALSMMVRSRHFEECIDDFFKRKEMHGTTHLSIRQVSPWHSTKVIGSFQPIDAMVTP